GHGRAHRVHHAAGQHGMRRYLHAWDEGRRPEIQALAQVVAAEYSLDSLYPARRAGVDRRDARLRVRTPQYGHVEGARQPDVVDVATFARDEPRVLATLHGGANVSGRLLAISVRMLSVFHACHLRARAAADSIERHREARGHNS